MPTERLATLFVRYRGQNNCEGGNMTDRNQADQLSEEIRALVRGANFGNLATLMRDGAPHICRHCPEAL